MEKYRIGLIRVATTEDPDLLALHGRLLESYFPCFQVTSRCIPDQHEGIHDDGSMARALPKILALASKEFSGMDAIVVSCAGDPAVRELRKELSIPVIGAGESAAAAAARCGEKIAVIGITDEAPEAYLRILGGSMIHYGRPEGVATVRDLMTEEGRKNALGLARYQKSLGAEAIAIACTGMANIHVQEEMEAETGLPVIDPVFCEGFFAFFELQRRRTRLN